MIDCIDMINVKKNMLFPLSCIYKCITRHMKDNAVG